jgi:hypothetical protein
VDLLFTEFKCGENVKLEKNFYFIFILFYFFIVFNTGRDASFHEILFQYYTVMIPAAPQETVGEAGIEPGTAA